MKIYPLWVFLLMMPLSAQSPLDAFLWKNRILVISLTEDSPNAARTVSKSLTKSKAAATERDLVVLDLSKTAHDFPLVSKLTPEAREELRSHLQIESKSEDTFILIGKDGGEKARQQGDLDLKKLFALIDTMPMRKQEQRSK